MGRRSAIWRHWQGRAFPEYVNLGAVSRRDFALFVRHVRGGEPITELAREAWCPPAALRRRLAVIHAHLCARA